MIRRLSLTLLLAATSLSAAPPPQEPAKKVYPPIAKDRFRVGDLTVELRRDTQTLARLSPVAEPGFDFVPGAREAERAGNGYVHIGDLNLRVRSGTGPWQDFASARDRKPLRILPAAGGTIAAADMTATMGDGVPLTITRQWVNDAGILSLRYTLANRTAQPVEVGALGMPMVFDNIITDRSLEQAHAQASFVDPYIGRDAGYLQVTRLNGKGPALLVTPEKATPLEVYRIIKQESWAKKGDIFTDKSDRGQTSEGFYDWMVASKAMADKEWSGAEQWNQPTSFVLAPGEQRTIGVRFAPAPSIRAIEPTLIAAKRPVAVGIPGYVVPTDQTASLFLNSPQPVRAIEVYPAGSMTLTPAASVKGWARYTVKASGWGRSRVSITYADGSVQTVHYYLTKPLEQVAADLGRFSTTKQWFDDKADPFGRAPAILSYDREANKLLTQEPRVWIAGMSDEGGAGAWVAAMMKQLDNPDPAEVAKLERVVDETVLGNLQVESGAKAGAVKKSLFWYDPARFPGYYAAPADQWKSWTAWDKKSADDLGRSYNYPHVAIGHWVLYRLARNHQGLVKTHDWRFYLDWAYRTSVAMMRDAPHYAQFGQMEGDVFLDILLDLKREGMTAQATEMERLMKQRADHWRTLAFPFGSEMAWDSTGQPEVYAWMRYFGYQPQADVTREVILGYDPTVPHWGYNGNARRYWDFLYGGKTARIERQLHHYGSALNAVPLFDAYRRDPADLHLLRVAYGGMMGGITNVDREGFASAAFHSEPDMVRWDPYTGDYGMGYYGHALAAGTYLVDHPTFGWVGFGGDVTQADGTVRIVPKDGARSRLFVAPAGQWVTLDAGKIAEARYSPKNGTIMLTLDPATATTPTARLRIEGTTPGARPLRVAGSVNERDAYTIALTAAPTTVRLVK
jgi:hypothetical protein